MSSHRKFTGGWRERGHWWFRLAGYGFYWKDTRQHRELFSERMGIATWTWRIGPWRIGVLWP